ncbi:amino acid adenylation domain-containing protein [Amycolatopsis xylanica]|uniref:Amino acid adenylation domain-containing protein n=1 Tax=Amycolatopsis xylanica TaxID=589385 RepID=A0A1H2RUZ5_9PSEU|nr:non-ribosomal peptide synthetase [Amycolatopsis xylanica]SDW23303.1 amino acid adenylation domain-containing protein [Amycolatopsis xylanica]
MDDIHGEIGRAALRSPDAIAVTDAFGEYTYRELDQRANRLAWHLRALGATGPVAVFLRRSRELPVALLAVLRASAAYVPIDPILPAERIALILADSGASIVLTDSSLLGRLPESGGRRIVYLDRDRERIAGCSADPLPGQASPDDLAYLMYTSGSTGRPKGVAVPHRGVAELFRDMGKLLGLGPDTVWAAGSSSAFDISVVELFLPLWHGGRVEVLAEDVVSDGDQLGYELDQLEVTHFQATPSGWRLLVASGWTAASGLTGIAGGEVLPDDLADDIVKAGVRPLWNAYGPTEASIWATMQQVTDRRPVPLGQAVGGARIRLLGIDDDGVGEIHIGGTALARGYHGQPELTAERFGPDPSGTGRLYRTGDRARRHADGSLEFVGRVDDQVKIRGYRVELGEIESALRSHPAVHDAAVVLDEEMLAAYVVPAGDAVGADELRDFLRDRLPPYMVVDRYSFLGAMPLNTSGKLDRRALPSQAANTPGELTGSPAERRVLRIAQEVLHAGGIGLTDDLRDHGMHSVLAMRLASRVNRECGTELTIRQVYQRPTVAGLAEVASLCE